MFVKMKFFYTISALLAILAVCHGYSFVIPPRMHRPGVCMYNGLMLRPGDNSIPSACQNMHCNDDGSIRVEGCGHYDMRDCRVLDPVHLDKPYPECCKMNFLCSALNGQVIRHEVSPLQPQVEPKVYA